MFFLPLRPLDVPFASGVLYRLLMLLTEVACLKNDKSQAPFLNADFSPYLCKLALLVFRIDPKIWRGWKLPNDQK